MNGDLGGAMRRGHRVWGGSEPAPVRARAVRARSEAGRRGLRLQHLALLLSAVGLGGLAAAPAATAAGLQPPRPPSPAGLAVISAIEPAASGHPAAAAQATGDQLVGVFVITAGTCANGAVTSGSSFRMIQPGGSPTGPFVSNSDSPCKDQTFTPLSPGTDGGLSTATYQPNPNPAFDSTGNGIASRITRPQKFFGVDFALSSNATDPQTGASVPLPSIDNNNGTLGGDVRALSVAYNTQHFNQGSPKPDGSHPGLTTGPTGTYNGGSGAYTLDWTSTIVGGPFNNFTGKWHLEGTFKPSSSNASSPSPTTPASGGGTSPTAAPAPTSADVPSAAPDASVSTPSLANTGLPFPSWPGLAMLLLGGAGLVVRRRLAVHGVTHRPFP